MQLSNSVIYIYILSIFSLFSPFTAYVPFFLMFIILASLALIYKYKIHKDNLPILLVVFCMIAFISYTINIQISNTTQFIKLILNSIFLSIFILFINNNYYKFYIQRNKIQIVVEIIIFLLFLQIFFNVKIMNLWSMPFEGVKNSMDAYLITYPTMYFGSKEKNILATKFVFLSILYYSFLYNKIFSQKRLRKYIINFMILFNIIYTFSRTAQLMFISFVFMFYIWKVFFIYKNYMLKILTLFLILILSIPISLFTIDKLFHLTLSSGDGLAARLELWGALYYNIENMNIFIGNGILSAESIISTYTNWNNNNFHNVFLNIFSDMGVIGVFIYICILFKIFHYKKLNKKQNMYILFVLFTPFFICINSQYLGYDSDIVIYFSMVYFFYKFLANQTVYYNEA